MVLTGTDNNNLTGNRYSNTLIGNNGNNILNDGSSGYPDTMIGGLGDDTYVVNNPSDVVIEAAGAGNDVIQSSVTYTLSANVENLTLTGVRNINGTGNVLNNIITGNTGDNLLDGGSGADTIAGSLGNDTYVVDNTGDVVIENENEGTDLVQSSTTYTLGDNIENLTLTGTANINGTGNALDNVLTGNSGSNVLVGDLGNDTINGGAGADTMAGGAGNDVYFVDTAGDVITENANEGVDTVQSLISYNLGANIENLTLIGTANINATGNNSDNTLIGNNCNNVLSGDAGNDYENGGAGMDILNGDDGNDTLVGGFGNDTLNGGAGDDLLIGGSPTAYNTGNRYILSIGVNDYPAASGDDPLHQCVNDSTDVPTLMSANAEWQGATTTVLQDSQATKANILSQINQLANEVHAGDQVAFWFSGHGGTFTNTNKSYIVPVDCDASIGSTTLISGPELQQALDAVASKIGNGHIYIGIDACNSGTFTSDFSSSAYSSRYTIMTSVDATQLSAEISTLQNSAFTYSAEHAAISEGWGDFNSDGLLTTNEWYQFTQQELSQIFYSHKLGMMTPQLYDGSSGAAVIASYDGADVLNGGEGNDTLYGGAGDDLLIGGAGSDTYLYGRNNGFDIIQNFSEGETDDQDVVQFTDGITHSDLDIRQWGNDLVAFMQGTPDAIKITDWFTDDRNKVSQFQFADGNVWNTATITEAANAKSAVMSGSGNLFGGTGDDIFINNSNAPCTMTGGAGNDIYYWMPISDATIVNSTNGTDMGSDTLQINTDLGNLGWNRSGSDLQLTSDSHTLTIQNWFNGSGYQVDNLQFADGSSFSNTVINQKILGI